MAGGPGYMRVHSLQAGKVEGIQYMQYATGQTFKQGELLKSDGSGNVIVMDSGVSAATLIGMAMQDADSSPGFNVANSNQTTTYTYRSQKVSVVRPNDTTIFQGILTNGSSTKVNPVAGDVEAQYGLTAYNSGATGAVWTIDKAKTGGSARVQIVGIDLDQNVVFFKFLASFLVA